MSRESVTNGTRVTSNDGWEAPLGALTPGDANELGALGGALAETGTLDERGELAAPVLAGDMFGEAGDGTLLGEMLGEMPGEMLGEVLGVTGALKPEGDGAPANSSFARRAMSRVSDSTSGEPP